MKQNILELFLTKYCYLFELRKS